MIKIKNIPIFIATLLLWSSSIFAKAAPFQSDPCGVLITPVDGETGVEVSVTINFTPVPGAVNHFADLGLTPGGTEILNNYNAGATGEFTPPQGLPENTLIYITTRGFFPSGSQSCDVQSFTTMDVTTPPGCTQLTTPEDGAVNVAVGTNLNWEYAPRATGYFISMGTTPGGTDVLNNVDAGNFLFYNIPDDLESLTTYYVTIVPYNENGTTSGCTETSFTTVELATELPSCTQLITPEDGEIEVALTPLLEWFAVDNAEGYIITVGSSSGGTDVLDNVNIGLATSTLVLDFIEGTLYYVTISPYNSFGVATGCTQTSFMTTFGCGPYTDVLTGEFVDLNPVINLEDVYTRCRNDSPLELAYTDPFSEIIWSELTGNGAVEISRESAISLEESGTYMLSVSIEAQVEAGFIICTTEHIFEVITSESPEITSLELITQGQTVSVIVNTNNDGFYEFSSVSENGPFQNSNILTGLDITNINIYVRDPNGCGIVAKNVSADPGFPKYFTPNDDGINDTWQVRGVVVEGETLTSIEIYDRYGKRIITISPYSNGWDGTYRGRRMLDQGFWYKANTTSNKIFTGYFALRL